MRYAILLAGLYGSCAVLAGCGDGQNANTTQETGAVDEAVGDGDAVAKETGEAEVAKEAAPEEPKKDPVARPSLLLRIMAQPIDEMMQLGGGDSSDRQAAQDDGDESDEGESAEEPADEPEADEAGSD